MVGDEEEFKVSFFANLREALRDFAKQLYRRDTQRVQSYAKASKSISTGCTALLPVPSLI